MDAITVMRRESMEQMRPRPLSGAVVALLLAASLLAAGVSPASAAVDEPDHLPDFSACLGPALESAGFGDTAGLGARAGHRLPDPLPDNPGQVPLRLCTQ